MDDVDMPIWEVRVQMERFNFGWADPRAVFSGRNVSLAALKVNRAPPTYYVLKSPSYSEWPPALNPTIVARDLTYFEAEAMCKLLNAGVDDG